MTTLTNPKSKTFANPSWTMAISSQPSALSRWWGQSLSKVSDFALQLKAVDQGSVDESDTAEHERTQPVVIQGNQSQLEGFAQLTEQYVQAWLGRAVTATEREESSESPSSFWDDAPEWQSSSGYSHRLSLGALQVDPILRDLTVTTTQLYDLAEILQQSVAEIQPLTSGTSVRALPERSPNWGKTAAVAAIALSLTGGAAWLMGGNSVFQTASESEPEDRISLNRPQGNQPGDTQLNLPPNFEVKPTKPPTPNKSSKTETAKKVDPSQSKETTVDANTDAVKTAIAQQKLAQSSTAQGTQKTETGSSGSLTTQQSSPSTAAAQKPSGTTQDSDVVANKDGVTSQKEPGEKSTNATTPPASVAEPEPTVDAIAEAPPAPAPETLAAAEQPAQKPAGESASPAPVTSQAPAASDFSVPRSGRRTSTQVSAAPVLRFFQSQWKGQDSLDQTLLYAIVVDPDGSVRSVTPQNEIASTQFSQVPLPRPGDSLVPPFLGSSSATFTVMLYPDGTVSVK